MAKTPAERKREQRERDKLKEEERKARLLAKVIKIQLYPTLNAKLELLMPETGIYAPQDIVTRLLYAAEHLTPAHQPPLFS
ncbi:hypothetical protein AKN94_01630 [Thiopseudomonas alkaliphila]|uniref:hypothetical protein n=1 Tax=Thiopseudomonas alkaliphila TaxID=1697053 RepID=UPI00069F19AB|nr:hypothetical protein [Thiopseudomonas alkaliphila]AKX46213.1 hypothetical protein AKN94_01630 [Thiopseudomonas alkaliphila]